MRLEQEPGWIAAWVCWRWKIPDSPWDGALWMSVGWEVVSQASGSGRAWLAWTDESVEHTFMDRTDSWIMEHYWPTLQIKTEKVNIFQKTLSFLLISLNSSVPLYFTNTVCTDTNFRYTDRWIDGCKEREINANWF